nr:T9SS type A sorting domain-containing protein [Bacteroidota bacterium]
MKSKLLTLLFVTCLGIFAFAQSFELHHDGVVIPNGGTITVSGDVTQFELVAEMGVKNISDIPVDTKSRKMDIDLLPGTQTTFCWGACFAPVVYLSPTTITILPDSICEEFSGHYEPTNVWGLSKMAYSFFNIDVADDSVYFYVDFNAGTVGITEAQNTGIAISNAYPNPTSGLVSFDYDLGNASGDAIIKIHNLLGAVVKDIVLTGNSGKITINVSALNDGVYFYSAMVNDQTIETKRLVVSK